MFTPHQARFALSVCALALTTHAFAQNYPTQPVRMLVGYAAGGGADGIIRAIAPELSEILGQPIVIDNRAGGGTVIATQAAASSKPDGYTMYVMDHAFIVNPVLVGKLPYDSLRDFVPVAGISSSSTSLMVVHPSLPVKTVKELIALARSKPGALSNGSSGTGTIGYLAGELFKVMTDTRIEHIPYKGGAQAALDVMAGRVQLMFDPANGVSPFVKSGKLRGLAVTGARRVGSFPDMPTVAESGVAGYEVTTWGGLIAPAGVPAAIITRLSQEMRTAAASKFVKDSYEPLGAEPRASTPEEFTALIRREAAKWADVVKRTESNAK